MLLDEISVFLSSIRDIKGEIVVKYVYFQVSINIDIWTNRIVMIYGQQNVKQ